MVLFTFLWRLENFSYFWQAEMRVKILSPEFHVTVIGKTKWRLLITDERPAELTYHQIARKMKFIKLFLERLEDGGLSSLHLHTEVALLKVDGSPLRPQKLGISGMHFKGGQVCILHENVKFDHSIAEILPQDILIVQCKMWSTSVSFLEKGKCLARTRVGVENMYVTAVVNEIGNFKPGEKRAASIKSVSAEKPLLEVNICLSEKGELIIIIIGKNLAHLGFCRVLILDNCDKWEECGQDSEWGKHRTACEFPLTLSFKALMNNKQQYLQNDKMTLMCEVAFYSKPVTPQRFDEIEYEKFSIKKNEPLKSSATLSDDLISLREEGTLCDTKLRAESETFPAHKTVLSARSPVFKKMFTIDLSESVGDCVDISDISAETVRSMLLFIYTDTTAAMDWENAMELYFAADKYQIDSLKLRCSNFLKLNIQTWNCCDLLLLSDLHDDSDLKQFVQEYIVRRGKEVFGTGEWKTFKDNHAQLAAETMCLKYAS